MYRSQDACLNSKWCKSKECVRDETQFDCWTCNPCQTPGVPTDICVRNCGLEDGTCRELSPGCSVCETCQTGSPTKQCALTCGEIGGTCRQVSTTPDCSICETCKTGTLTRDCEKVCASQGGKCRQVSQTPDCSVCDPPACDIPAFKACADTFSLQGCIDACPYVSATCPPGTPPNTDCKGIDQGCVDTCSNKADTHLDGCLVSSHCTKEEVIAGGGGA